MQSFSYLVARLEPISIRTIHSKILVDHEANIMLYNSSTKVLFSLKKFYLEELEILKLDRLLGASFQSEFMDLPKKEFFIKNKHQIVGPTKIVCGKSEKTLQTRVSLVCTFPKSSIETETSPVYLVECWQPDSNTSPEWMLAKTDSKDSNREPDFGDEHNITSTYDMKTRKYALGFKHEQEVIELRNNKFYSQLEIKLSKHEISKRNLEYDSEITTMYLGFNGKTVNSIVTSNSDPPG